MSMDEPEQPVREDRRVPFLQLTLGLGVMAVGLAATLENLGWWAGGLDLLRTYWPIGLVLVGLTKLSQATLSRCGSPVTGVIWVAAGVVLLLRNVGLLAFSIRDLFPLLWVFLGSTLVYRALTGRRLRRGVRDVSSVVNGIAIMGGVERTNSTTHFRGGQITAIMGGYNLDLRQASVSNGEAVIDLLAFWGGIELRVPPDWAVISKVVPILGGFEDRTAPPKDARQQLVLRGIVLMGGVEVKN